VTFFVPKKTIFKRTSSDEKMDDALKLNKAKMWAEKKSLGKMNQPILN